MLDFQRQRSRVPNYLSRREQLRLLVMVFTLGLIVVALPKVRDPKTWAWMWGGGLPSTGATAATRPIDTRLERRRENLPPDGFMSQGPSRPAGPRGSKLFPGVRSDLLRGVRDDTVFRADEAEAFFHLLQILAKANPGTLERASSGMVGFTQLFKQPNAYRGELVTIRGTVHRALLTKSPQNDYGIKQYYQVVLEPERAYPVVVYCLELPPGFPEGDAFNEPVELTGFFYKRWAYLAGDGIRTAPLLLARRLSWLRPPPAATPLEEDFPFTTTLAIAAGISLAVVLIVWSRTRRDLLNRARRVQAGSTLVGLESLDFGREDSRQIPPEGAAQPWGRDSFQSERRESDSGEQ